MKALVAIVLCLFAQLAAADLYRWIDPETGSVKYSSYPPPWYGDAQREKAAPRVDVIPSGRSAAAVAAPAPGAPAGAAQTGPTQGTLEARLKSLLQQLSVLPSAEDFSRGGTGFQQQMESYRAVAGELDKLDPKGAERRRAEAKPVLDRMIESLRTQFADKPPPAPPALPVLPAK